MVFKNRLYLKLIFKIKNQVLQKNFEYTSHSIYPFYSLISFIHGCIRHYSFILWIIHKTLLGMCLCACPDPHLVLLKWSTLLHMPYSYSQSCCICVCVILMGFPGGSEGKNLPVIQETWVPPCSGRSLGGGNGNPLQYSSLENSMDRGARRATVSPWGCKEWDATEVTEHHHSIVGHDWAINSFFLLSSSNSFLGPVRQELTRYDLFWINFNFLNLFNSLLVFVFLIPPLPWDFLNSIS